jgi:hypothetical protein
MEQLGNEKRSDVTEAGITEVDCIVLLIVGQLHYVQVFQFCGHVS